MWSRGDERLPIVWSAENDLDGADQIRLRLSFAADLLRETLAEMLGRILEGFYCPIGVTPNILSRSTVPPPLFICAPCSPRMCPHDRGNLKRSTIWGAKGLSPCV